ncbi:MAG: hydrogenase small subunit [Candidatus Omnitrophota bacterium]
MKISRRDFLKYCIASAAVLGLDASGLARLKEALANSGPQVLWLTGSSCTGCSVSLANLISPSAPKDIADLLINVINLDYHINLMGAAGDQAVQTIRDISAGSYILIVEGGIPGAFNGNACVLWNENGTDVTALSAVRDLASHSIANIAVGTCASFGGVAAAAPNPTQVASFSSAIGKPTINIAGCPVHPDWIVYVVAQLLAGVTPALDSNGRPSALFGGENNNVHERCPRRERDEANTYGVAGLCLEELGCRGPHTQGDCPVRKWNNNINYCMNANALCIGCTERSFPAAPLFKVSTTSSIPTQKALAVSSAIWDAANLVLRVNGTGKIGAQAAVKSASGVLLAATMIKRDGTYTVSKADLSSVPESVTVLSNAVQVTANVSGAPAAAQFAVSGAAYNSGSNQLVVSGTGPTGNVVTLNAGSTFLGAVTISTEGNWSLTVTSPSPVPTGVSAVCNGVTLTANVTGIPASTAFAVSSAAYTVSTNRLSVSGSGPAGANVSVRSGATTLGSATISSLGNWSVGVTSPSPVPASISAVCNGVTLTANVTGIPASTAFAVSSAAYTVSTNRLSVSGSGPAGANVSVRSGATTLGSATISSSGNWSVGVTSPSPVPTSISAVCNGVTLTANVTGIPAPGAGTLTISRAEYDHEDRELLVRGTGQPNATVRLYNGSLIGSVRISSRGSWRFEKEHTSYFRTIRAESNGISVTKNVTRDS